MEYAKMANWNLKITEWPDFTDYVAGGIVKVISKSLFPAGARMLAIGRNGWIYNNTGETLMAFVYGWRSGGREGMFWGRARRALRFVSNDDDLSAIGKELSKDCEHDVVTNIDDFPDRNDMIDCITESFLMKKLPATRRPLGNIVCSMIPDDRFCAHAFRVSVSRPGGGYTTFHVEVNGPVGEKILNDGRTMSGYSRRTDDRGGLGFIVWGKEQDDLFIRRVGNWCGIKLLCPSSNGRWEDIPLNLVREAEFEPA